jgi:DNA-binding transcriptional regulator YiaG
MTSTVDVDRLVQMIHWLRDGEAREIRKRSGLSMAQVASVLDVTPGTVLRWEDGTRVPSGANARKYADLLHKLNGIT